MVACGSGRSWLRNSRGRLALFVLTLAGFMTMSSQVVQAADGQFAATAISIDVTENKNLLIDGQYGQVRAGRQTILVKTNSANGYHVSLNSTNNDPNLTGPNGDVIKPVGGVF